MDPQYDLIVIGGGPGGSTVATLVAMQGHKVLLLERERFPRYSIGESLLPITIHGICAILGVADEIKQANFTKKWGGSLRWGTNPNVWSFRFSDARPLREESAEYAFQVERMKFDTILLRNAQRRGVDVREQHQVTELLDEDNRVRGVAFVDAAGVHHVARARFVVDAGGHRSNLYKQVGEREFSEFFRNVALFCYFEGGKRMPEPHSGNILSAAFDQGWFWYIPLSPTLTSVGAVVERSWADKLQKDHEQAMRGFIDRCPAIKDLLANATRVTEGPYGQYRVRIDYSYTTTRFWKPGLILVGDAACFVDPVFSTGVHLTTYSALLAARSINSCLRDGMDEAKCFDEFEHRYRMEFENIYKFLIAFYDMHHDEDSYFWSARKILHTEEKANEAFVTLVSGISTTGRSVFEAGRTISKSMHAYHEGEAAAMDAVGPLIKSEHALKAQATGNVTKEAPVRPGGLVPSPDGLHWIGS